MNILLFFLIYFNLYGVQGIEIKNVFRLITGKNVSFNYSIVLVQKRSKLCQNLKGITGLMFLEDDM